MDGYELRFRRGVAFLQQDIEIVDGGGSFHRLCTFPMLDVVELFSNEEGYRHEEARSGTRRRAGSD
jgi:hypothetical protein